MSTGEDTDGAFVEVCPASSFANVVGARARARAPIVAASSDWDCTA